MAVCKQCNREMLDKVGCIRVSIEFPDGTIEDPVITHGKEKSGICHDCNAPHGEYHHPGCDMERCPKCGHQIISCGCLDEDEVEE